uniref:Uncharacterized protein n=1 Tax=Avena sativa TaxID=4498 RepID=A0ACD6A797_AVESA
MRLAASLPPAMTSAVASNRLVPAAAPAPSVVSSTYGCRVSFGRDAAEETPPVASSSPARPPVNVATPAISKDFIDFEFSFGGCTTSMLPADELFADGKLLPLQKDTAAAVAAPEPEAAPPARLLETMPATPEPMKAIRGGAAAGAADQYVFSPKAPSCSSRWRELLGLKRAAAATAQSPKASPPSPSPSAAAALAKTPGRTATGSSAARSLKFLLQRSNGGRASSGGASDLASAPLLRDSSDSEASLSLASSRFSHSSSSSSGGGHDHDDLASVNPRFSLDSAAPDHNNPPRLRLVPHRHSTSSRRSRGPSPPPPPACVTADSPRMNSSGKIVFQTTGLERSCSSPCSLHAAARSRSMARAVDRSYSSGVRVAPVVLNVPVCSRPVFGGFFKDKTKESAANKESAAASLRSSSRSSTLGRKPTPQRWSGELPKPCG